MSGPILQRWMLIVALAAFAGASLAAESASPPRRTEAEWKAYFKELDRSKEAESLYLLGTYYAAGHPHLGRGKADPGRAFEYYEKAAELGHAQAQYRLAYCYEHKLGVRRASLETAFEWYLKAADQEVPAAQLRIGELHFDASGPFYNREKAFFYLSKAAERGLPDAQRMLGDCYKLGWSPQRDYVKALTWYMIAAAQDDEKARSSRDTFMEYYHLSFEEVRAAEKAAREFRPKP